MANIFDYLTWRGDLSFKASPFNQIDNLIFAQLSYMPFEYAFSSRNRKEVPIGLACRKMLKANLPRYTNCSLELDRRFLLMMSKSSRFADTVLTNYVSQIDEISEKQFSAITVRLDDGTLTVAFRGTDNTLVGWKEDLNLAFEDSVPAQIEAVKYLNRTAAATTRRVRVVGHSKGGNLAVYASAFCTKLVRNRIIEVFNNDGPGFLDEVLARPGFDEIAPKVVTFVPQSSMVGILLDHKEDFFVIHSDAVGGVNQHSPYTWQLEGVTFIREKKTTDSSRVLDIAVKDWLRAVDPEKRKKVINGLWDVFESTDVKTLEDLANSKNSATILKALSTMDPETRSVMQEALTIFSTSYRKALIRVTRKYSKTSKKFFLDFEASMRNAAQEIENSAEELIDTALGLKAPEKKAELDQTAESTAEPVISKKAKKSQTSGQAPTA